MKSNDNFARYSHALELKNNDDIEDLVTSIQEWSDSHPAMTRREKFIKMCNDNGFSDDIASKNAPNCEACNGKISFPCAK